MNQFIERELNNCKVAKPELIAENTFHVSRISKLNIPEDIEQGHFYMIEVADYIIHPYEGFTLHDNWNNGIKPTSRNLYIEVIQVMGKMVKVNSKGDDGLLWTGWLPRKSITIKQVIA